MVRKSISLIAVAVALLMAGAWMGQDSKSSDTATARTPSPAEGYTVHVTAPHMVNGHVMGPYHHYCKVIAPDPQIVCLIYDTTDPNAMLSQIEFIMAKKLTRNAVARADWNRLWHDHTLEIASGRVKVWDLPPDKAKEVADLVSTTDGIIYSFEYEHNLPNGKITMAQSVGHQPLTAEQYAQSQKETMAKSSK